MTDSGVARVVAVLQALAGDEDRVEFTGAEIARAVERERSQVSRMLGGPGGSGGRVPPSRPTNWSLA